MEVNITEVPDLTKSTKVIIIILIIIMIIIIFLLSLLFLKMLQHKYNLEFKFLKLHNIYQTILLKGHIANAEISEMCIISASRKIRLSENFDRL